MEGFNLFSMAFIRSIFIGRGRKSAGNVTLRNLRGVTIASERIVKNSSNTTRQAKQRADFGVFAKEYATDVAILGRLTQKPAGTRSAYNRLFKAIYQPDPVIDHSNEFVFGNLYDQASQRSSALPYMVEGNAPSGSIATISVGNVAGSYNAVFNWYFYNLPTDQLEKLLELDREDVVFTRVYYNSAGIISQETSYPFVYNVASGGAWPSKDEQAVDTCYVGMDGAALRVQIAVYITANEQEVTGTASFVNYARLRGLPKFDLAGLVPSVPWDQF